MAKIYTILDTNVLVSSILTKNPNAPTRKIINNLFENKIIPIYNKEIIIEYNDVLNRKNKFDISQNKINQILDEVISKGILIKGNEIDENLVKDKKDTMFLAVLDEAMDVIESSLFLITGNLKHFPDNLHIVSPREYIDIVENHKTIEEILSDRKVKLNNIKEDIEL